MRIASTVAKPSAAGDGYEQAGAVGRQASLVPVLVAVALLMLGLTSDGAFAIRYWAPVAVFGLVVLACTRCRRLHGAPRVAVGALWGLAGWTVLSSLWSQSPESAVTEGGRTILYAGLFALAVMSLHERRSAQRVGAVALAALAVIVLATFLHALLDGPSMFLAGRLDAPVGYRNGTAALFVLAFWPLLCVAAARGLPAFVRAPAFAVAVLALGLAFMTQSRGAAIGFAAGAAVAIALGPDRLRRSWLAVVAVGAIAVASGALLDPYDAFREGAPVTEGVIEDALAALGLVGLVALAAALLLALFDNGLRVQARHAQVIRRGAGGGLAALAAIACVGTLVAIGNPVSFAGDKYDEFRALDTAAPGETRLGSTGGQRYDLWRIALNDFRAAPLAGAGQGSYRFRYYEERETDRNLSTPHSLPLALLAETGLVGLLAFVAFLGAVAVTIARGWRGATAPSRRWGSAAAAGGIVLIAQSSVDWLWEVPGLAGLSVLALGLATALLSTPERALAVAPRPLGVRITLAAAVATAVIGITAMYLSDFYVRQSRSAGSAQAQLDAARRAERLNPLAVTPLLLQAGALEELGRVGSARDALGDALELEPRSFALLALRGDLEVRAGNEWLAQIWYLHALDHNPGDVGLRRLADRAA